jgi:hypothetical protein
MKDNQDYYTRVWINLLGRFAWFIIVVSLFLMGLSIYYTANHLAFQKNRSELLARDQRLLAQKDKVEREFGSKDTLVVVVENHDRQRSIAFAEALATELRQYPAQFVELFYRVNPERMKPWVLLYLEPGELLNLKDKLLSHRLLMAKLAGDPTLAGFFGAVNNEITQNMVGELFTGFLEEKEREKIPDLSLLNAALEQLSNSIKGQHSYNSPFTSLFPQGFRDWQEEGYFITGNDKYLLFLITTGEDGYAVSEKSLVKLRQVIEQVKTRFPEIKVGVTGTEALEDDEMASAFKDITLATWLSLLGQIILLIIFFRSFKRTLVEGVALLIGLSWTFGLTTLVVGHLNILSMIFAPLMLGLTIDYGIHWFCRLEEEQNGTSHCTINTLLCTQKFGSPGIIYAAITAAVSFLPLAFTGFKGLAELGLILFMGILVMLVVTLTVLPAMVMAIDRCKVSGEPAGQCAGQPRPFLSINWRRPGVILVLGIVLVILGGVSVSQVPFDLNPLNLQNKQTESVAWELKLLADSRYSSLYGVMVVSSPQEVFAKTQALKNLPTVSKVESIFSFLPLQGKDKHLLLADLKPMFDQVNFYPAAGALSSPEQLQAILGRIHFKLSQVQDIEVTEENKKTREELAKSNQLLTSIRSMLENPPPQTRVSLAGFEKKFIADLVDKWELIRSNLNSGLPRVSDLPLPVQQRFISPEGTFLIRVFPAQDVWEQRPLERFVDDLRKVDSEVVGEPILLYTFIAAFRNACLWAAGIALLAVTLLLLFFFRNLKLTFMALIPLIVGTSLTLNLMWLLDIPFNQANVLFLPLILGEGVEFGIIILARWQLEESARTLTLPASTAKGVALAALTTTLGFGSLMVSGHQGVFSLGLLATVGSLSVLIASLSVLPAFLRVMEDRKIMTQAILNPWPNPEALGLSHDKKEVS